MIVLITGGRDYKDSSRMHDVLRKLYIDFPQACLVQGGANGADRLARDWAIKNGRPCLTMHAAWDLLGNRAGPVRNQWMLDHTAPAMVLAFPGGSGTADMRKRAKARGIPVHVC
jgi:hypothetical protein